MELRCLENSDRGEAGDNAGILLRGIEKTDIKRGMVICNQALTITKSLSRSLCIKRRRW